MKQLPDILTSAEFWASIGTLLSAAGAWFTFVGAARASRRQRYEGVLNLLAGIETELQLVEAWASGKEGDLGYLKCDDLRELTKNHPDWFNPSRLIFTFDVPTITSLTNSPYVSFLNPIVPALVRLSQSIHRLFDYLDNYNSFVASDPDTYQNLVKALAEGTPVSAKERVYANFVFGMNRTIHQNLIGGADSIDDACLYKAFRSARAAIGNFKASFRVEPLPRWYWILHVAAVSLAAIGLFLVLRWFDIWPKLVS
jgi:hypothetical protein